MLTAETLRGIYAATVIPFKDDESLDEKALRKQTAYVIDNGVHAIMSTGGTGEFPHLSREERKGVRNALKETGASLRLPLRAQGAFGGKGASILMRAMAHESPPASHR